MWTLLLVGCSKEDSFNLISHENKNSTPKELLSHQDADIFLMDDVFYSKASDIKWVIHSEFTIGEEIGEVYKQQNGVIGFINGTTNILPVGTKNIRNGQWFCYYHY